MTQFKAGDRVAAYDRTIRRTGVVETHTNPGWVYVRFDERTEDKTLAAAFLPEAVRRLKPKRKLREFWLEYDSKRPTLIAVHRNYPNVAALPHSEFIHVREVRKK